MTTESNPGEQQVTQQQEDSSAIGNDSATTLGDTPTPAQAQQPESPQVLVVARTLARLHAEACNVNYDDLWKLEFESFIFEARQVVRALAKMPDPCVQLRNICEALSEEADTSVFSREEWERIDAENVKLQRTAKLYDELLFAVHRKFPDESRHETALRYIRKAEAVACNDGQTKASEA